MTASPAARADAAVLIVSTADAGARLDAFVTAQRPELSRTAVQRLVGDGDVLVNGRRAKAGARLSPNDEVLVRIPPPRPTGLQAEAIDLAIVYEDDDLLVVDKPPGMPVHPSAGHDHGTLVNAVLHLRPGIAGVGGEMRPGIVHRLDKDTSGLVIVAKHDAAHRHLSAQLKAREVEKTYHAIVEGRPKPTEATIDAPIGRDPRHRKRMAVVAHGGREARTRYRVLEAFDGATLLEANPETGRTHQIRVHLAAVGHPIIGDVLYGRPSPVIGRQALHALRLRFRSPTTGADISVEAPLPTDLAAAIDQLRKRGTTKVAN